MGWALGNARTSSAAGLGGGGSLTRMLFGGEAEKEKALAKQRRDHAQDAAEGRRAGGNLCISLAK